MGEALKEKSDAGGVVGGVTGSAVGVEIGLELSSVISISGESLELELDRLVVRPLPKSGNIVAIGDWLASSEDPTSLGIRKRVRSWRAHFLLNLSFDRHGHN